MFRILLFLPLTITGILFPKTWSGSVYDHVTESSLPYSVITHVKSESWIVTDQFGTFSFSGSFSIGDTIRIQRYGYITQYFILPAQEYLTIFLEPDPILIDPIITTGIRSENKNHISYSYKSPVNTSAPDHRSFFTHFPGVTIRTYGGPGSIGLISVDGGSATHTSIFFNGFNLDNNQTGITDLSQIPLVFLQTANMLTSNGSNFGEETITIESKGLDEIAFENGSFGHQSWHFSKKVQFKRFKIIGFIGQQKDKGDFSAKWRNDFIQRTNNDFYQQYLSIQAKILLSKKEVVQFFGFVSEQKRGNPGQIWSPSNARRFDQLSMIGISKHRLKTNGFSKHQFLIKISNDNYYDPLRQYSASHHLLSGSFNYQTNQTYNHHIIFNNQLYISLDTLQSTDAGKHSLVKLVLGPGFIYNSDNGFSLDFSIKGQVQSINKTTVSNTISTSYSTGKLSFGISGSNVSRNPSFNELYWAPGGNPDLKSESLSNQKIFLTYLHGNSTEYSIELYNKFAKDLIHWVPVTSYWQPINVNKVLRRGIKGKIDWHFTKRLTGSFAINRVKSTYLVQGDHYGKSMVYAPDLIYTNTVNVELTKNTTLSIRSHYMSEVISLYSWPKDIILPELFIHDISFTKDWQLSRFPFTTSFSIQNLTDISYEMSKGYPEMGRSYRLSLNIQLTKENDS